MIGKDSFSGATVPRNSPPAGCGLRTSGGSVDGPHGESATKRIVAARCRHAQTSENENGADERAIRAGAEPECPPGVAATNIPGTGKIVAIARSSFFT